VVDTGTDDWPDLQLTPPARRLPGTWQEAELRQRQSHCRRAYADAGSHGKREVGLYAAMALLGLALGLGAQAAAVAVVQLALEVAVRPRPDANQPEVDTRSR
jgi:hypothetical protein